MPTLIPCPCGQVTELFTAAEVAERLGIAGVTLRNRSAKKDIGLRVDARSRLYTSADVEALRARRPAATSKRPDIEALNTR